jgi:hypothetical protein
MAGIPGLSPAPRQGCEQIFAGPASAAAPLRHGGGVRDVVAFASGEITAAASGEVRFRCRRRERAESVRLLGRRADRA